LCAAFSEEFGQVTGAAREDGGGRGEKFIANDKDAAVANGRNVAPLRDGVSLGRFGAITSSGPGEDDYVRIGPRDLFVGDSLAGRNDHLASSNGDKFGDPRRGSDAGTGPGFRVDAQGALAACCLTNLCERMTHLADDERRGRSAANESGDDAYVGFDVREASRIERKESKRILQELAQCFRFEGNRTDHQIRFEFEDLRDGFKLPAIAELREVLYRGNIRAPASDADELRASAQRTKNGCSVWRERDDAELLRTANAFRHTSSLGCPTKGRNECEKCPAKFMKP